MEFKKATEDIKSLESVSDDEKLELYGLYKQALYGNCNLKQPNKINYKEYLKYNAWNENKDLKQDKAMKMYITKVKILLNT